MIDILQQLCCAIIQNDYKVTKSLLLENKELNVNTTDFMAVPPINYSIFHKNIKLTKLLIKYNAEFKHINLINNYYNQLNFKTSIPTLKYLIKKGININYVSKRNGETLLDFYIKLSDKELKSIDYTKNIFIKIIKLLINRDGNCFKKNKLLINLLIEKRNKIITKYMIFKEINLNKIIIDYIK